MMDLFLRLESTYFDWDEVNSFVEFLMRLGLLVSLLIRLFSMFSKIWPMFSRSALLLFFRWWPLSVYEAGMVL